MCVSLTIRYIPNTLVINEFKYQHSGFLRPEPDSAIWYVPLLSDRTVFLCLPRFWKEITINFSYYENKLMSDCCWHFLSLTPFVA